MPWNKLERTSHFYLHGSQPIPFFACYFHMLTTVWELSRRRSGMFNGMRVRQRQRGRKPLLTINPDPVKPSCVCWNQIDWKLIQGLTVEMNKALPSSFLALSALCWIWLPLQQSSLKETWPWVFPSGLVQLRLWNSELGAWNSPRRRERLLQARRSSGALVLLISQAGAALWKAWCVWWAGCQALRSR